MFPQLLQHLQFMYDADWYATDIFSPRAGGGMGLVGVILRRNANDDSPVELQRERIDYIDSVRKGKTDPDFVRDAHQLMDRALNSHRRIYVVIAPSQASFFQSRFISDTYEMVELTHWAEPCNVTFADRGRSNWLA